MRHPPASPVLIPITVAAQRLGVHPDTLRRQVRKGRVPIRWRRIGKLIRVFHEDVEKLIEGAVV